MVISTSTSSSICVSAGAGAAVACSGLAGASAGAASPLGAGLPSEAGLPSAAGAAGACSCCLPEASAGCSALPDAVLASCWRFSSFLSSRLAGASCLGRGVGASMLGWLGTSRVTCACADGEKKGRTKQPNTRRQLHFYVQITPDDRNGVRWA